MIYDYLILGGGPSGLTLGIELKRKYGERKSLLVLEKEDEVGGLCRSKEVDGSPFDIGGGHFLDVRRPAVDEFCFGFLPSDEWNSYDRKSTIFIHDKEIDYPIEANIWQMPKVVQGEYLSAIKEAGANVGEEKPERFTDWIYWKLGDAIADNYMLPYNRKMFGRNLDSLGTYWLEKLPNVSYEDTLKSCEDKKRYGTDPGHSQFLYPKKYGYGQMFIKMGEALSAEGSLMTNAGISRLDLSGDVPEITITNGDTFKARQVITTIPWDSFEIIGAPKNIVNDISKLKSSGIVVSYIPENLDTDAQWIYYPDEEKSFHRILVRHNFCPASKGHWQETNKDRYFEIHSDLAEEDHDGKTYELEEGTFVIPYAYPLNTIDKPNIMEKLLTYMKSKKVIGLGRWGEHMHYNSDVVMERAMNLAKEL